MDNEPREATHPLHDRFGIRSWVAKSPVLAAAVFLLVCLMLDGMAEIVKYQRAPERIMWIVLLAIAIGCAAFGELFSASRLKLISRILAFLFLSPVPFIFLRSFGHYRPQEPLGIFFDISSDGQKCVFTAEGESSNDLYLLDIRDRKVERLTNSPDQEMDCKFSSDGKEIVFSAAVPNDRMSHIYLCNIGDKRVRQLTDEDTGDRLPSLSPDGLRVVFSRGTKYCFGGLAAWWTWSDWEVYSMKVDGTDLQRIPIDISRTTQPPQPVFSRDGKSIVLFNKFDKAVPRRKL